MSKTQKTTFNNAYELYEHIKNQPDTKEIWSTYPFREGKIKAVYFDGNMPRYGATLKPLTDKQIDDIENIMQSPLELSALRVFLVQQCRETQLETLTWRDILRHFQRYYATNHKPVAGGKAGEKEQVGSKFASASTWFKSVVEKCWQIFTKSFWEAVFERVWPK